MNVLFLGRTQMLYNTIECFKQSEHRIVGIITAKAAPEYTRDEDDFRRIAEEIGCPFYKGTNLVDIIKEVNENIEIGISVNWPTVINSDVIELFTLGILNAHSGDLPRYRGNACPNWAILNGEDKIGMSVHFMEPRKLDSGPIVLKEYISCDSNTTISDIYKLAENLVPNMFVKAVDILDENPQKIYLQDSDVSKSLRCYPRIPGDSYIDWSRSAEMIDRLIRASCWPFEGAYSYCNGIKFHILSARIEYFSYPVCVVPGQVVEIDKLNHYVKIACGDGIICITKMTLEDGTEINSDDVIRSMRYRLGYRIEDKLYDLEHRISRLEEIISMRNSDCE